MKDPHCRICSVVIDVALMKAPRFTKLFIRNGAMETHDFEVKAFDPVRNLVRFELIGVSIA